MTWTEPPHLEFSSGWVIASEFLAERTCTVSFSTVTESCECISHTDEAMHVAYRIEPHWDGATLTFERTSRTASGLGAWSDWTMATCEGQITDQEGQNVCEISPGDGISLALVPSRSVTTPALTSSWRA